MTSAAPASPQTSHPAEGHLASGRKALILTTTLIVGIVAYQLSSTMLSPALPEMARDLRTDIASVSTVSSLFFLAGAVATVILTRWSDYFGRRKVLLIVLGALTLGTIMCVFAPNLQVLLVGRMLEGVGIATYNLAYLILSRAVVARLFGIAVGCISAVNGGVGGVDGYLGGLMSDTVGYRWIFVFIFVFAAIAIVLTIRIVPNSPAVVTGEKMDWWGAAFMGATLICLTQAISEGSSHGWTSPTTIIWFAGGIIGAIVFVLVERRHKAPFVPIRDLASRYMWPVLLSTVLCVGSIYASLTFTIVVFAQSSAGWNLSASVAAFLFLAPAAILGAAAAPIAGRIAGRGHWVSTLRVGMATSLALTIVLTLFHTNLWASVVLTGLVGAVFFGSVMTALNGVSVVQTPPEAPAALPGLNGSAFGIGASVGIAAIAPLVSLGTASGFTAAFWTSIGLGALGVVMTLTIKPRKGELTA